MSALRIALRVIDVYLRICEWNLRSKRSFCSWLVSTAADAGATGATGKLINIQCAEAE